MVWILGGAGLVGSGFARACADLGRPYAVITRENYREFVGRSCTLLINANGNSRKPLAEQRPLEDFDASVRSVCASLVDFRFEHYVLVSSCDVYPDRSSPSTTAEDSAIDPARQSFYGLHKHLAELCVRRGAPRWLVVRAGGFVGPGLRKNPVFDILSGGPLWLDPDSELQFMHTDDFARAVLTLIERGAWGETVNLCGLGVVRPREIEGWIGRTVSVTPGSPRIRCEIDLSKAARWVSLPQTRATVQAFVTQSLAEKRR